MNLGQVSASKDLAPSSVRADQGMEKLYQVCVKADEWMLLLFNRCDRKYALAVYHFVGGCLYNFLCSTLVVYSIRR